MRNTKVKMFKKSLILSCAVLLLSTGIVYAANDWQGLTDETNAAHQNGGGTVTIDSGSAITTNGTAINLGAPPVPGTSTTVTVQGNGSTITAQTVSQDQSSQIFVNSNPDNTLIIQDTNLTGGYAGSGAAVQNANIQSSTSGETAGGKVVIEGTNGNRVQVTGNTAGRGGAIYNLGETEINNVDFSDNHAVSNPDMAGYDSATYGRGGVIFNGRDNANPGTLTITNSTFSQNSADAEGDNSAYSGVIHNRVGTVNIYDSQFGFEGQMDSGNYAKTSGGVMVNQGTVNIYDSSFDYNNAESFGGVVANGLDANDIGSAADAVFNVSNTAFRNNYSSSGSAIYNFATRTADFHTIANINDGVLFSGNGVRVVQEPAGQQTINVSTSGGAIYNQGSDYTNPGTSDAIVNINMDGNDNRTVVFENNVASQSGGAISNEGVLNINNALFQNNGTNAQAADTRTQMGGAIYNTNGTLNGASEVTISNSNFVGNTAQRGGAIYNVTNNISGTTANQATVTLVDTNFSGNQAIDSSGLNADTQGGAIYATTNTITNIKAQNKDVNIGDYGTSLENGYDTIKLAGTAALNLDASAGRNLNLNSTIYGDARTTVVNANSGQINANAPIKDSTINVNGGVLHFEHDRYLAGQRTSVDNTALNNIVFNGGTMSLLNHELIDQFRAYDLTVNRTSNLMLDVDLYNETMDSILQQNITGTVSVNNDSKLNISHMASITDAKGDDALILFTDVPELIGNVTSNGSKIIEGRTKKYEVTQITQSSFNNRPLGDDYADGEYFQFNEIGDSDSVIAAPVAAQAAFLIQDNLYRQSFANMDMVTLMTPEQRMAWKMRNKYASAGYHTGVYAPNIIPEERDGFYVRPFTNFENVPLKNGPKVSNVSYGMLVGGESDLIDLGHGWDGNFSIFGAYHGSHQAYNGVGIWQNGGTLGAVGTAYKGNFWTGVTANIGASAAEAQTAFGNDGFPILMTGAAWKSGYNWGLLNNKLIIQPSYMMSYTFVNVFDYTNSAGVRITQDPLHAIEIIPGLRIIGNLKNGWQPYIGLNMTWNIMDKTKFYANDVALTPLSIKPYFEYGVGLQKRYGDRFTGFGQAMLRNGGRNGIAFTLGFRWALGH